MLIKLKAGLVKVQIATCSNWLQWATRQHKNSLTTPVKEKYSFSASKQRLILPSNTKCSNTWGQFDPNKKAKKIVSLNWRYILDFLKNHKDNFTSAKNIYRTYLSLTHFRELTRKIFIVK